MTNEMITMEQVDARARTSKAMVESGFFKDTKSIAQAFVKIQAGAELGIQPFAAMSGINIIMGKPELGANLIAALIKNDPRYNYRVLELTDDICRLQFYEDGEKCGVSEFSKADATKAGTKNMGKFPRNMLFARALTNGAKWHCPGIFGGVAVYAQGELTGSNGELEKGDIIDAEPEPAQNHLSAVIQPDEIKNIMAEGKDHLEPAPLPDDEGVIMESSAVEFFTTVTALIDRYTHEKHVKNAAKQLGYDSIPGNSHERLEMYRALKAQARKRDDEDAELEAKDKEPAPLFDEAPAEPTGAYKE